MAQREDPRDAGLAAPPAAGPPAADQPGAGFGLAALSICESLLVSLVERGLLGPCELDAVLEAAREANLQAEPGAIGAAERRAAAALIRRVQVQVQSARPDRPRS